MDILQDGSKAESLLHWAEDQFLAYSIPDSSTSLRSTRINIHAYDGNTTSDHIPLISTIPMKISNNKIEKNVH